MTPQGWAIQQLDALERYPLAYGQPDAVEAVYWAYLEIAAFQEDMVITYNKIRKAFMEVRAEAFPGDNRILAVHFGTSPQDIIAFMELLKQIRTKVLGS